jgi:hypothetical protein
VRHVGRGRGAGSALPPTTPHARRKRTLRAWQPPRLSQQRDGARVPTATSTSPRRKPRVTMAAIPGWHPSPPSPGREPTRENARLPPGWMGRVPGAMHTYSRLSPSMGSRVVSISMSVIGSTQSRRGRRGCAAPHRGHGHQMFAITGGAQRPAPRSARVVGAWSRRTTTIGTGTAALARFRPMSTDPLAQAAR